MYTCQLKKVFRLKLANWKPSAQSITASNLRGLGLSQSHRSYWGFSRNDDDDNATAGARGSGGDEGASGSRSSLVSAYGDNSPTFSPILILPTSRRPVFPGYLTAMTLRDSATVDAIVNNKSSTSGYVGVFLRTSAGLQKMRQLEGTTPQPTEDEKILEGASASFGFGTNRRKGAENIEIPDLITDVSDIYKVGTFASIQNVVQTEFGSQLLLMGQRRVTINEITSFGPPTIANVDHWERAVVKDPHNPHLKALLNEVLSASRALIKYNPLLQEQLLQWVSRVDFNDPHRLADFATALTTAEGDELQRVLEAADAEERLSLTLDLLAKERELAKLQREISRQVEEKVSKQQKEYFLREQLKSIKQELGMEKDDKEDMLNKYKEKLKLFESRKPLVAEATLSLIREEVEKLQSLEKNSPEFNVTRSYLDWLVALPWGNLSQDVLNLQQARVILDEDHYGLQEIKERILEFIAVGKLKGTVAGKIICFIGPPGVGKTSIAKSIARSLDKKFYRFSVGGLTDTAEIKGHRRTYIGAMPGKPVQCLKSTGCLNPLILIDEIDKLGRSYNGDPASALLELLDPNQNSSFVDHYLDTPIDFSNVLFVCTANDESAIPGALRDRMEIIRLSGYDIPEKVAIATRYLVPKALKEAGLRRADDHDNAHAHGDGKGQAAAGRPAAPQEADGDAELDSIDGQSVRTAEIVPPVAQNPRLLSIACGDYSITEDALKKLVKNYCRESGVRSLEKMIEKIVRKIAYKQVGHDEEAPAAADIKVTITADDLEEYLGKPLFPQDTIYDNSNDNGSLPPGVVMGLAWNPLGGSALFIESAAIPVAYSDRDGGGVKVITGQLGDVMRESVNIAYTYARQFVMSGAADAIGPSSVADKEYKHSFFNSHQLHVHVPEGAVSKDGPSAGVAMTTALISIASNCPLQPRVAMTGEISLTGKVLPVGGIKEKTLAARRAGARIIILPAANKCDYDELPDYVKNNLTVHFATEYRDVFNVVFQSREQ